MQCTLAVGDELQVERALGLQWSVQMDFEFKTVVKEQPDAVYNQFSLLSRGYFLHQLHYLAKLCY